MPPKKKITKEEILKEAYHIACEQGIDKINARYLSQKLSCSVQPIFFNFSNMEKLKQEVMQMIVEHYHEIMKNGILEANKKGIPSYKGMGLAYIKFAKDEPILFQTIFMEKTKLKPVEFMNSDATIFSEAIKLGTDSLGISKEEMENIHLHIWIYTHGIASLIATNTCDISLEEASKMLTEVVSSLIINQKGKNCEKNN